MRYVLVIAVSVDSVEEMHVAIIPRCFHLPEPQTGQGDITRKRYVLRGAPMVCLKMRSVEGDEDAAQIVRWYS
jgi:hypothetical protein